MGATTSATFESATQKLARSFVPHNSISKLRRGAFTYATSRIDKIAASPTSNRKTMLRLIVFRPPGHRYARLEISFAGHASAAQLRLAATQRYPLRKISVIPGILEIQTS